MTQQTRCTAWNVPTKAVTVPGSNTKFRSLRICDRGREGYEKQTLCSDTLPACFLFAIKIRM